MHPAHVVQVSRHHPRTVGGDDVAQFRNRQLPAVLCDQAGDAQPAAAVAPVARHSQHFDAAGDLAEGDEARSRSYRTVPSGFIRHRICRNFAVWDLACSRAPL